MSSLAPFAAVNALINQGMQAMLADTIATWQGGAPFGVLIDVTQADAYSDVHTTDQTMVSLPMSSAPGIAEGARDLRLNGQVYRVTGPVVPDSGGWATFPVVMEV